MTTGTIITKAELSRQLGVTKARISQLVTSGLPVLSDGSIDRRAALSWITTYSARPNRGGKARSDGTLVAALNLIAADDELAPASRRPSAANGFPAEVGDDRFYGALRLSLIAGSSFEIGSTLLAHNVPKARAIADEITAAIVKSAAAFCDDLVDDEELPAPISAARWGDHVWFRTMPTSDTEWEEVESEATHRAKR